MTSRSFQASAKYTYMFRNKIQIITALLLILTALVMASPASNAAVQAADLQPPVGPYTGRSSYYKFDIIAAPGDYTEIKNAVSINYKGKVAFIAKGSDDKEHLYVGDGFGDPLQIDGSGFDNKWYFQNGVQINDRDQVIANYREAVGSSVNDRLYRFDGTQTNNTYDADRLVARGRQNALHFDFVYSHPSINNQNQVVFTARDGGIGYLVTARPAPPGTPFNEKYFNERSVQTPVRPMIADDAPFVVARHGKTPADPIKRYNYNNLYDEIEFNSGAERGEKPGISPDGKLIVYAADTGIYAYSEDLDLHQQIAGFESDGECSEPELGFVGVSPTLNCLEMPARTPDPDDVDPLDNRVGISYIPLGPDGPDGDSFVVTFVARPLSASRANPHVPHSPLFFSNTTGLWSLRVDIEKELDGDGIRLHPYSPIPVVQIGNFIDGNMIEDIVVFDPISNVGTEPGGTNWRTQRRGDHRIAFWAKTGDGKHMVVRATNIDSDQDGLFDHWEQEGIDIDSDGTVDLNLAQMGASIDRRDLFVELDWTVSEDDYSNDLYWDNSPAPGVTDKLKEFYEQAPALEGSAFGYKCGQWDEIPSGCTSPDSIPAGITLHLDAGPGHSVNMPTASLQGGDEIGQPGRPDEHIDAIYYGLKDQYSFPGIELRSFHDIKENYFGTADKRARELAFHYGVLADFASGDSMFGEVQESGLSSLISQQFLQYEDGELKGRFIKITSGVAAGALRRIVDNRTVHNLDPSGEIEVETPWGFGPGSGDQFMLLSSTTGEAETDARPVPDNDSIPANDFLITLRSLNVSDQGYLASPEEQWRTIAHELGHNLGLRHNGKNDNITNSDQSYKSIMSYRYVYDHRSDLIRPSAAVVSNYSNDSPFNDWQNLDLSFPLAATHLGNSLNDSWYCGSNDETEQCEGRGAGFTAGDYIELYGGMPDLQSPVVAILSPTAGAEVALDGTLAVTAEATDNYAVKLVEIQFDADGDGVYEVLQATPFGVNYGADFNNVSGPLGERNVRVIGQDTSGHRTTVETTVSIVSEASPPETVPPDVTILTPTAGEEVMLGYTLAVTAEITDNVAVGLVEVQFDVDGDGVAEVLQATPFGGGNYGSDFSNVSGSTGERTVRVIGQDTAGNSTQVETTVSIIPDPPPEVTILSPAAGEVVDVGGTLAVTAQVTDNAAVSVVEVQFDANGDGEDEVVQATYLGGDTYGADFSSVSGPDGDRVVRVVGEDASGGQTAVDTTVSIVTPDLQGPEVTILTPAAGAEVTVGDTLAVTAEVTDNVAVDLVEVQFDVDGDGVAEVVQAMPLGGDNYGADFSNISGPAGDRSVHVSSEDTSGNNRTADTIVSIVYPPPPQIRPGFDNNVLPANDDGYTGLQPIGFPVNFFGTAFDHLYVNNNGNVTFDSPLATYTPFDLNSTNRIIIAPFFGDVDTRAGNVVTYGQGDVNGRPAFAVNWPDVGCYDTITSVVNNFQLVLIDRSDIGQGDFDIEFNIGRIQWESGQASGGNSQCQDGSAARVGYSNGTGTSFELPGSGVVGAFLDSNLSTGLIHNGRNSLQDGRYVFEVRNGSAPIGGTISGQVLDGTSANQPVSDALVQVCDSDGCDITTTNDAGEYSVSGLGAGQYEVTAFPPEALANLEPGTIGPLDLASEQTLSGQDIILAESAGTSAVNGHVRTVEGQPIEGATVTLYRSDSAIGPFDQVPDGSAVMAPSNRTNPDATAADGSFGWQMFAGFYVVRAEAEGCVSPDDPAHSFVETGVLTIPPQVADLDLRLDCPSNQAPVADAGGPYEADEGESITLDGGGSSDPDGEDLTYAWDLDNDGEYDDASGVTAAVTFDDDGVFTVGLQVTYTSGESDTASAEVTVSNVIPTIALNGAATVDEGSPFTLTLGELIDPGDDTISAYIIDWGDGDTETVNAAGDVTHTYDDGPLSPTITVDLVDEDGTHVEAGTLDLTVNNVVPTIDSITAPSDPLRIDGGPVSVAVEFSDSGTADTHEVTWDWNDESSDTQSDTTSPASEDHSYTEAGVYEVTVTVSDDDSGSTSQSYEFVVIYDPSGGFVTGGGWIWSEAGWCQLDELCVAAEGKANSGFVSRYRRGAQVPTGNTEFNFPAGGLNFHSDSYDWLIINQGGKNAQYKGSGTINGDLAPTGEAYQFMIWAKDLDLDADDTFRIRIWYEDTGGEVDVYDNGFNQAIGGGNITVRSR